MRGDRAARRSSIVRKVGSLSTPAARLIEVLLTLVAP
jgi:hypothetical protein